MNTATFISSSAKRASRARTFPAGSRATGILTSAEPTQLNSSFAGSTYASIAHPTEDFFSQIWTPGLLDRLQTPLTRYRE